MKLEDFENIYSALSKNECAGKLALLDAPTGSGKSYNVRLFLCSQALKEEKFRAFFVTNQKKNIDFPGFINVWDDLKLDGQSFGFENVAILRSLPDTIDTLLNKLDFPNCLMSTKLKDALARLKSSYELYQQIQTISPQSNHGWNELNQYEYEVRRIIANTLAARYGVDSSLKRSKDFVKKIQDGIKEDTEEVRKWIYNVYPTIDLECFSIILCTTAKFISSYKPFFKSKGSTIMFNNLLNKSLIVFDEFDATKKQYLEKTIDDALKISTDLIVLFNSIHEAFEKLQQGNIPKTLRIMLEKHPSFSKLSKVEMQLLDEYHLSYLHKVETPENKNQKQSFLMHGPTATLVSGNQKFYSHEDNEKNQVIIDHDPKDDLHFIQMLYRVSGFIRKFNRMIIQIADEYRSKRNHHNNPLDTEINQIDACFTVYDALGFEKQQAEMLMNIETEVQRYHKNKDKRKTKPNVVYPFQSIGLFLFFFEDSEQHEFKTRINAAFLNTTAENFLLSLTEKAMVLGLSATAFIPTVLDNYDLKYLKSKLDDRLIDGKKYLTDETIAEFNLNKRYEENGIKVQSKFIDADGNNITTTVKELIEAGEFIEFDQVDKSKIAELDSLIAERINMIASNKSKKDNPEYYKNRYVSLFESFIYFINRPDLISFLGLQSKLPDNFDEMSRELVEQGFDLLVDAFAKNSADKLELRIIAKNKDYLVEDQIKDALKLPEQGKRVYLLSAYQSIGVGQNLQHDFCQIDEPYAVNIAPDNASDKDPRNVQMDLSGIYLGEITNILTNAKQYAFNLETIRYIIQLYYMMDANEIDRFELLEQFRAIETNQVYKPKPANVKSVLTSQMMVLIQALGRMNRTFNKSKSPLVLANCQLKKRMTHLGLNDVNVSPELSSLLKKTSSKSDLDVEEKQLLNEKFNLTEYTKYDLEVLLRRIRTEQAIADQYQFVRESLLKYPTIDEDQLLELQNDPDHSKRGLKYLPNPQFDTSYKVKLLDMAGEQYKFGTSDANIEISSEASRLDILLKYPGLEEFFKEKGYATKWKPKGYIINPIQFRNLYRGILGEVCGKFIFEDRIGVQLTNMKDLKNNELFDYTVVDNCTAIDFKNWESTHQVDEREIVEQIKSKLEKLNQNTGKEWKVIVLNVVGSPNDEIVPTNDKSILQVPAMLDDLGNCLLDDKAVIKIRRFINGDND
ncbi:hypothetical protein [Companilactobacillus furfuricola]|uniref:hypothetical protein n=1 Tax=Companilactobacillus furfuricola TaxID=1462575 RepID=UPI000F7878D8|nr:hypothetical protein [Companilactobacillus furfuricola]